MLVFPIIYFLQFLTVRCLSWVEPLHERPWTSGEVKTIQVKTKNNALASPLQGTLASMAPSFLSWPGELSFILGLRDSSLHLALFSRICLLPSSCAKALEAEETWLRMKSFDWKIRHSGFLPFKLTSLLKLSCLWCTYPCQCRAVPPAHVAENWIYYSLAFDKWAWAASQHPCSLG